MTVEKKHKRISTVAKKFNITIATANKYINMSNEEIELLNNVQTKIRRKKSIGYEFSNMIYKMIKDDIRPELIFFYVLNKGYPNNYENLNTLIRSIAINNFNRKFRIHYLEESYEPGSIVISRNELLKEITAKNKKYKHNDNIINNINLIIEKYPVVKTVIEIYDSFYSTIMGNDTSKLDEFVSKYETKKDSDGKEIKSLISTFADGIKKDITPAKNAISYPESSGFVEGNNCKFKLIKRIVYGRPKLVNLFKKCFLCFSFKRENFNLKNIINIGAKNATISSDI